MSKFAKQFQKRTDIHLNLKDGLKCDALVVVGTKSHAHLHAAEYMHSHMDKVSMCSDITTYNNNILIINDNDIMK